MDTDMLAVIEDLLDSWPGTLIVVSHDRYFIERVTDQQYAIIDEHLRHVPGGVDQYLRLQAEREPDSPGPLWAAEPEAPANGQGAAGQPAAQDPATGMSGADRRAVEKEIAAIDRKLAKLVGQIEAQHQVIAEHDQSDYQGILTKTSELRALQNEVADLETRWLEIAERVG
jgi:ATPase subunit of ABC transporter with duplicated ATPase domains